MHAGERGSVCCVSASCPGLSPAIPGTAPSLLVGEPSQKAVVSGTPCFLFALYFSLSCSSLSVCAYSGVLSGTFCLSISSHTSRCFLMKTLVLATTRPRHSGPCRSWGAGGSPGQPGPRQGRAGHATHSPVGCQRLVTSVVIWLLLPG